MENNKQKPQDQEKLKALDQVLAQIEKHYGKGAEKYRYIYTATGYERKYA